VETCLLIQKIAIGILDPIIPMKIRTGEIITGTLINPFRVLGMKARIPTGVLGILILEIMILAGAKKVIGILDRVMPIKTTVGKKIAAGVLAQVIISRTVKMKVQMKILVELVVTRVEVVLTEVALEVEVIEVEEIEGALEVEEAGETVGALVAGETVGALVVEVDRIVKVLVVDGDQAEAAVEEGVINLVVGTTGEILVRMGPLTGRRGQIMLKDGVIVMDPRLGIKILVTEKVRAGAKGMQIRSILAGTREVEVNRDGVQQVMGVMIIDLRPGTMILGARTGRDGAKGMQITSVLAGTKVEISQTGVQQVELMILAGIKEVEVSRAGVLIVELIDLRLGTRIPGARTGRVGAKGMQIRSVLA